jgi:hypothetical protein
MEGEKGDLMLIPEDDLVNLIANVICPSGPCSIHTDVAEKIAEAVRSYFVPAPFPSMTNCTVQNKPLTTEQFRFLIQGTTLGVTQSLMLQIIALVNMELLDVPQWKVPDSLVDSDCTEKTEHGI